MWNVGQDIYKERDSKTNLKGCVHSALIFILSCIISCRDSNDPQTVSEQLRKIEDESGLTLPADSRVDHFKASGYNSIEPWWIAKVVIPAESYESFKETLLAKPTDNTTISGNRISDSTDWWKPVNVIITKLYWANSYTLVEITVSRDDDKEVSVYIDCIVP